MTRDRGTGIVSILLGLYVFFYTSTIPNPTSAGDSAGPRVFPYITAAILVVCGIGLVLQKSEKQVPFLTRKQWLRLAIICGVYLGYVVCLWAFGFLIATVLCLFTLSSMFSKGKSIAIWKRLLYSIGVTAVLYVCFFTLLGMSLPVGKFIRWII